jgi:dTDP-4-amino-4,6-dideoxygalactose transaminase
MVEEPKVFLLEMGEPVAIVDLARQMIRLAGLRPGDDIPIKIIGSRLGERLHEQLHDEAEVVHPTAHPSIRAVTPAVDRDEETMAFFLELLARKCEDADDVAVTNLLEQLLRRNGIDCRLTSDDRPIDISREPDEISLDEDHDARPVSTSSHSEPRPVSRPAILGGASAFAKGVPFCRPARPPLSAITRRYERSYERGILTNGPLVAELETRTAAELDVAHVVAVSSCTTGLMLALQAVLDGRPGPVVIPSFTFSASGHAVMWNGRRLRFVECDPGTFQIDVPHMVAELDGAAALLATHVFGAPCNPWAVERFGRERGVPVVFDAAHAFGATTRHRPLGSFGDVEVFSLTPTKVLVAGEGGLIATNDTNLAAELRIGRNYGNPGDYDTQFPGLNARMSEFHAATALESLEMLDETLGRRRELAALYVSMLDEVPGIETQQVAVTDASTYKDFTVVVDPEEFGLTRSQLARALRAEGIETRKYFDPPLHRQTAYRHEDPPELSVTNLVASRVLSLPIYPDLGDDAVSRIAEIVHDLHVRADEVEAYFANEQASGERVFELD